MKVYSVQRQHTAGAYKTIKSFSKKEVAEAFMENLTTHDPLYNNGNKHNTNRYRVVEEEVE